MYICIYIHMYICVYIYICVHIYISVISQVVQSHLLSVWYMFPLATQMSTKEPYISTKEPYISTKEFYVSANEPCVTTHCFLFSSKRNLFVGHDLIRVMWFAHTRLQWRLETKQNAIGGVACAEKGACVSGTRMDGSCPTYEWVTHVWVSHIAQINESSPHTNESRHTYTMSHVTNTNGSC